jgi:hypothetical protein
MADYDLTRRDRSWFRFLIGTVALVWLVASFMPVILGAEIELKTLSKPSAPPSS